MTIKQYIEKYPNESNDMIYYRIVCDRDDGNLFGVAFYGEKGTPKQRRKLNYIWKTILKHRQHLENE
jgi:hypothetical protein